MIARRVFPGLSPLFGPAYVCRARIGLHANKGWRAGRSLAPQNRNRVLFTPCRVWVNVGVWVCTTHYGTKVNEPEATTKRASVTLNPN
jgi:hypothetical protein